MALALYIDADNQPCTALRQLMLESQAAELVYACIACRSTSPDRPPGAASAWVSKIKAHVDAYDVCLAGTQKNAADVALILQLGIHLQWHRDEQHAIGVITADHFGKALLSQVESWGLDGFQYSGKGGLLDSLLNSDLAAPTDVAPGNSEKLPLLPKGGSKRAKGKAGKKRVREIREQVAALPPAFQLAHFVRHCRLLGTRAYSFSELAQTCQRYFPNESRFVRRQRLDALLSTVAHRRERRKAGKSVVDAIVLLEDPPMAGAQDERLAA